MKVRMNIQITGTRNGHRWPVAGSVVDLPSGEALDLLGLGYAVVVPDERPQPEKKTAPKPEKRSA